MRKKATTVAVAFDGNCKHYHYYTNLELKKGDKVIVNSPYSGWTVVTVIQTNVTSNRGSKWIIEKLNTKRLEKKEAQIKEYVELINELNARIREFDERRVLEVYAQQDKGIRELLNKLDKFK